MTGNRSCRLTVMSAAVALAVALPLEACPFCSMQGQTLLDEIKSADLVVVGTLANPRLDPSSSYGQGKTDLTVEAVLKNHEFLRDKKIITVPRYLPTDNNSARLLMFCEVFRGNLDLTRGVSVKGQSAIVKYLQGTLAVKDKPIGARLRFFFDYLDNADLEIANDAYKEFANASYKDYQDIAAQLPAGKIAGWVENPDTPSFRMGLYTSMLGHCGTDKDAVLLRGLLDNHRKRLTTGLDGALAGYVLLKPKEGWEYLCGILKDPSREFLVRYAALRAARFFYNDRPDVIGQDEAVQAVCLALDQSDIADLAIDDLRRWKRWEVAGKILALHDKSTHNLPIMRRSILKFALSCQKTAQVSAFLDAARIKDADLVNDVEELHRLENSIPKPATK